MDSIEYWTAPEVFEPQRPKKVVAIPTVLVVDDDAAFRELLAEFLWDAGYRVREAVDGLDAIRRVRTASNTSADLGEQDSSAATEIDLVIVDLCMPNMSGLELAAQLRSCSLTLPVITMSAFPDAAFYRNSYEIGCVAAFAKPFSFFEFLKYIDSLFDR